jgi:hypothetical protein
VKRRKSVTRWKIEWQKIPESNFQSQGLMSAKGNILKRHSADVHADFNRFFTTIVLSSRFRVI